MKRGELRWGTPPVAGAAGKRRPFLVVSEDAFNENVHYPKVMVVHLTSMRRLGGPYAWEVEVPRGVAGLPRASVVKCQEIYTLLKAHLGDRIGTLPRAYLERINGALALSLGLPFAPPAEDA